ncbi:MAG: type II toxin-antitoxin system RelE/ParE family toxin [Turicibacter sp.]|nr:type II toxin-antitoxin system RelE/ParE family toxin [Turicibacter sp.]
MLEVRYLPVAEQDLEEIVDYLADYSIQAAHDFIDELEKLDERLMRRGGMMRHRR